MIRAVNARGDNEEVPFLNAVFSGVSPGQTPNLYEFDDEFDDVDAPLGQCTVLYNFEGAFGSRTPSTCPEIRAFCSRGLQFSLLSGNSEGTISITEGELLSIMEEDKGDGWMRVLRGSGEEGFIPSSYVSRGS